MKVRVKLSGSAKAVDVGDVEQCTLLELQRRTGEVFELGETSFSLSLNRKDALSGDTLTLSQLGIVPGDLVFVLCRADLNPTLPTNHNNSTALHHAGNNVTPSPSTASSASDVADDAQPGNSSRIMSRPQVGEVHGGKEPDQQMAGCSTSSSSSAVPGTASEVNREFNSTAATDDAGEQFMAAVASSSTSNDEDGHPSSPCPLEDPEVNRCLQEPLLCRESTASRVPALLRDLFGSAACRGPADALWVALHTLMLEVGFRPRQQDGDFSLSAGWNRAGFYKQEYCHLGVSAQHSCSLIGVSMGPVVIVHGITNGDPPLKTDPQTLKVSDYVPENNVSQDVCQVYKNLERLSRTVKDSVCQRLMSQLSEVCGFPVGVGLLSLSYEIKLKLLSFLSADSLTSVGQVCRDLNVTYRDPCLWRRLHLREFGQNGDNSLNKNWYQLYKEAYQVRKERRRLSRHRQQVLTNMPPWLHPPSGRFPPLGPPLYPEGIVGGDYDLNPEFASSIPHPLGGRPGGPNPFLPSNPFFPGGPGLLPPGGPFLPRPRFDDPFGPDAGPGGPPPFMSLGGASSRRGHHRHSPFSSMGGHRFL